ncbi:hypothetical protein OG785_35125 [Streptomyces sp. NBC_00006]|uniref:hypothetical protein n=1 Tax=Streptomyces sp. NBC_00006 TaxID=2975619 RepID=UPI0022598D16|nr:hypothetical protein [Streptomyces sp. NBC_00006]MCX5535777.1 hypothetical protein [Streptomyces sp. NBC_00006]
MKRLVRIMCFDPAMATDELHWAQIEHAAEFNRLVVPFGKSSLLLGRAGSGRGSTADEAPIDSLL